VLWVFNGRLAEWEGALPQETLGYLEMNRAADPGGRPTLQQLEFRDYPYISTFNADYSAVGGAPAPGGARVRRRAGPRAGPFAALASFTAPGTVLRSLQPACPVSELTVFTPAPPLQELVTLLSQQASWQVLQVKDLVKQMAGITPPPSAAKAGAAAGAAAAAGASPRAGPLLRGTQRQPAAGTAARAAAPQATAATPAPK
jgi:hypothetical protein